MMILSCSSANLLLSLLQPINLLAVRADPPSMTPSACMCPFWPDRGSCTHATLMSPVISMLCAPSKRWNASIGGLVWKSVQNGGCDASSSIRQAKPLAKQFAGPSYSSPCPTALASLSYFTTLGTCRLWPEKIPPSSPSRTASAAVRTCLLPNHVTVARCKPCANPYNTGDMPRHLSAGLTQHVLHACATKSPPHHVTTDDAPPPILIDGAKITGQQCVSDRGSAIPVLYETHWNEIVRPTLERELDISALHHHSFHTGRVDQPTISSPPDSINSCV